MQTRQAFPSYQKKGIAAAFPARNRRYGSDDRTRGRYRDRVLRICGILR